MLLKKIVKVHGKKIKTMKTGISGINTNISGIENNIGDMALSTVATDLTGAINETHDVPFDIQELYKPLIAPFSVSLSGFVEGSYLLYGKFYNERRFFVKVSKTTAMSGTTAVGTVPYGYWPTVAQTLTAYGTDGNVLSGVTVTIGTTGAVGVVGNVDPNTVIFAAYSPSNPQSGVITKNDIEKLIAAKFADTGWVEVPAAWLRSDTAQGTPVLKYRKIGTTVHLYGSLKTTAVMGAGIWNGIIDIPFWPQVKRIVPQVNGNYDACVCSIDTSGNVEWYNKVQLNTNGSMIFHLSYLSD